MLTDAGDTRIGSPLRRIKRISATFTIPLAAIWIVTRHPRASDLLHEIEITADGGRNIRRKDIACLCDDRRAYNKSSERLVRCREEENFTLRCAGGYRDRCFGKLIIGVRLNAP